MTVDRALGISVDVGRRPNVVFVLVDDQGYGDIGRHGHPRVQTPELDRLWSQSVRFTDYHVSPMCTPTRGSLLTGMDPLRHGAMNVSSGRTLLRRGIPTLAELMRAADYRTAIFGKWHLGDTFPYRPQDRGFEKATWFPSSHVTSAPDRWENDYFNTWFRTEDQNVRQFDGYCTDILFDEALQWIEKQVADGESFFSYISLNAVHVPLLVEDKYREPYRDLDRDLATYLGMVANIDENIGKLDASLRRLKIWDETILVYMSDNGAGRETAEFYNAGMRGHKAELWEGGHRVPFFIRWPRAGIGGDCGRDINELTTAQDFAPTILELCGPGEAETETAFDGHSLASLLTGQSTALEDRMVVVQYSRMPTPRPAKGDAAILWDKWRLVDTKRLYNVADDPGQVTDVAGAYPDVVATMQRYYNAWWSGIEGLVNSFSALIVGDEAENPVLLSPAEWRDCFLDQSAQVRAGLERNGIWGIEVAQSARYRMELRRWPRESDLPLCSPAPEFQGGDCMYPAGKALNLRRARLRVGDREMSVAVNEGDRASEFTLYIERGSTTIQTWFEDESGRELCGAYYVYVERLLQ